MPHGKKRSGPSFVICFLFSLGCLLAAWSSHGYLLGASGRLIQMMSDRFGASAEIRLHAWRRAEAAISTAGRDDGSILESVNTLANRIPFATDMEVWGVEDYWATPAEFISVNAGDCEDYAIAKYFTLRAHGIPASKLRIVYVKALFRGRLTNHIVLAYYATPVSEPLILDNIQHSVLPASKRPDLVPVYSFNDEDVYREGGAGTLRVGGAMMVRRWSELHERLKKERFP